MRFVVYSDLVKHFHPPHRLIPMIRIYQKSKNRENLTTFASRKRKLVNNELKAKGAPTLSHWSWFKIKYLWISKTFYVTEAP